MDKETQDRIVTEFHELTGRIDRLVKFFATEEWKALDETASALLHSQLQAMNQYHSILAARLDHAKVPFKT